MPRNLTTNFRDEKNKLESAAIIRLFKIYTTPPIYYAEYDKDVTFGGQLYTAIPMSSTAVSETSSGEVSSITVTIAAAQQDIIAIMQNQEMTGLRVDMLEVFANNLADQNAYVGDTFFISSISVTQDSASFALQNILSRADVIIPKRTYSKGVCQFRFKSLQCGFALGYADVSFTATNPTISWGGVSIIDPVTGQNVNISGGNATFTGDPIYIVYQQGSTTLLSKSRGELKSSTGYGTHPTWVALCKYEGGNTPDIKSFWSKTVSGTGSLTTCDLTLSGGNGCINHNNRMRWGAFPGVGIGGRYYL